MPQAAGAAEAGTPQVAGSARLERPKRQAWWRPGRLAKPGAAAGITFRRARERAGVARSGSLELGPWRRRPDPRGARAVVEAEARDGDGPQRRGSGGGRGPRRRPWRQSSMAGLRRRRVVVGDGARRPWAHGACATQQDSGQAYLLILELMKVPRMESKLQVLSFKIQFASRVADLRESLNILNSLCNEIRISLKWEGIMKKISFDTLNFGTTSGYVIAFRLDSLLQLIIDARGTKNKKTPMHNLCKELAARSPQLLNFYDDLASLDAASKIQLEMLSTEMHEVDEGLKKVQLEYDASQMDGPVSETFLMKLKEFTDNAQADVESLSSLYSIVGKNVDALIKYFGEDPSRCPYERARGEPGAS
ncbi:formin-like protein 5 isoform X2 [Panicum virgatum]|uniref:formin-like protein 5 isoform X2 n=1 Tax=Panicum virgatum TaxID=38727 RepID=UPI0019D52C0D|nr:formin-like protein 5 isoform X2 [Panicum virgatum]